MTALLGRFFIMQENKNDVRMIYGINKKDEYINHVETSKSRIQWVDSIKGLGMLLVMISHLGLNFWWQKYACACYMAMFFVISGYTYKNKYEIREYLADRAKRLLIPWFFYGTFLVFIVGIILRYPVKKILLNEIKHLYSRYCFFPYGIEPNIYFMKSGNSPLWFLTALFVSGIAFKFIETQNNNKKLVIIYIIVSIIMVKLPILLPWSIDTACLGALFMLYGMYIRKRNFLQPFYKRPFVMAFLLVFYFILLNINGGINMSIRYWGDLGGFSVIICLLIGIVGSSIYIMLLQAFSMTIIGKFLAIVGRSSITILCLHFLFYKIIEVIISKLAIVDDQFIEGGIKFCIALSLGLMVNFICNRMLKIWPHVGLIKYFI